MGMLTPFLSPSIRVWFAEGCPSGGTPTQGSAYWWSLDEESNLWLTTAHDADAHRDEHARRDFTTDIVMVLERVIVHGGRDESITLPEEISRYLGVRDRPAEQYLPDFHPVPLEVNGDVTLGVGITFDTCSYVCSIFHGSWIGALYPGPERLLQLSVSYQPPSTDSAQ